MFEGMLGASQTCDQDDVKYEDGNEKDGDPQAESEVVTSGIRTGNYIKTETDDTIKVSLSPQVSCQIIPETENKTETDDTIKVSLSPQVSCQIIPETENKTDTDDTIKVSCQIIPEIDNKTETDDVIKVSLSPQVSCQIIPETEKKTETDDTIKAELSPQVSFQMMHETENKTETPQTLTLSEIFIQDEQANYSMTKDISTSSNQEAMVHLPNQMIHEIENKSETPEIVTVSEIFIQDEHVNAFTKKDDISPSSSQEAMVHLPGQGYGILNICSTDKENNSKSTENINGKEEEMNTYKSNDLRIIDRSVGIEHQEPVKENDQESEDKILIWDNVGINSNQVENISTPHRSAQLDCDKGGPFGDNSIKSMVEYYESLDKQTHPTEVEPSTHTPPPLDPTCQPELHNTCQSLYSTIMSEDDGMEPLAEDLEITFRNQIDFEVSISQFNIAGHSDRKWGNRSETEEAFAENMEMSWRNQFGFTDLLSGRTDTQSTLADMSSTLTSTITSTDRDTDQESMTGDTDLKWRNTGTKDNSEGELKHYNTSDTIASHASTTTTVINMSANNQQLGMYISVFGFGKSY